MLSDMEGKPLSIGHVGGKTSFAARSRTIDRMIVWKVVCVCLLVVMSAPVALAVSPPVGSVSGVVTVFAVVVSRAGKVGVVLLLIPGSLAGGGVLITLGSESSGGGDAMVEMGVRSFACTL